jgi:hypothetical protein
MYTSLQKSIWDKPIGAPTKIRILKLNKEREQLGLRFAVKLDCVLISGRTVFTWMDVHTQLVYKW